MTGNPGFHHRSFGGPTVTAPSGGCLNPPNEALPGIGPAEAAVPLASQVSGRRAG